MFQLLNKLRVVEASSFVAAPSCGMHLAQLGAEVIRFDTIGGGPDFHRWPLARNGSSLFWEGLNKGKKSLAVDLRSPEGRELAINLITAPGDGGGLFVTNFPEAGFLSHKALSEKRHDLITARVKGQADGSQAVDYTVNASVGFPFLTGPDHPVAGPVNHVLPAWDLLAGAHASMSLLAAERYRSETGIGQEVSIPLAELALTTLGHLGFVGEVTETGRDRPRFGNALYGAFGRDFPTSDGKLVMIVAITPKQWRSLVDALGIGPEIAAIESELGVSFAKDEGVRFIHRERIFPIVERITGSTTMAALASLLDQHGVCWSPYRTVHEAVRQDIATGAEPGLFADLRHASGFAYPTPGAASDYGALERQTPVRAPFLGEHTEEVLASVLGLPSHEIARLHDRGVVASA